MLCALELLLLQAVCVRVYIAATLTPTFGIRAGESFLTSIANTPCFISSNQDKISQELSGTLSIQGHFEVYFCITSSTQVLSSFSIEIAVLFIYAKQASYNLFWAM